MLTGYNGQQLRFSRYLKLSAARGFNLVLKNNFGEVITTGEGLLEETGGSSHNSTVPCGQQWLQNDGMTARIAEALV